MILSRRQMLLGAAATTAAVLATPTFPSLAAAGRFAGDPGAGRMHYGAVYPYTKSLPAWESTLGRHIGVRRSYFSARQLDGMVRRVRDDKATGRLSHVSTKPPTTWKKAGLGGNDVWLEDMLGRLKAVGSPVFLSLHHEPENDVGDDGMRPPDWVAMQRRAISKGRELGATNVSIVPVLMVWTFHPTCARNPADWMVPEATMFGIDNYNEWSRTNGKSWTSFGERMVHALPYAADRPIVIGEYGCRTDSRRPRRAADWMDAAHQYALSKNVVAMSYFNTPLETEGGTYELDVEREPVFKWLLNSPPSVR